MAEVSIDIAKESSVAEVKSDTAAIKADVTTVKSDVATVKTNVAGVKSKTDLIGSATDTGGSATAGTVMGKLNKLIGGSSEKLIKPSTTPAKTITTGFGSGFNFSKVSTDLAVTQSGVKLTNCLAFSKNGLVTIEIDWAADSIKAFNANTRICLLMMNNDVSMENFIDKPIGTVVDDISEIGDYCSWVRNAGDYIVKGDMQTNATGTKSFAIVVKKGECYTPVAACYAPKTAGYTMAAENMRATAVRLYYEDAEDIIYS